MTIPRTHIWVVMDECWNPCFCSSTKEACEEHIFDAIREEIEEAAQWVVREFTQVSPPPSGPAK